MKLALDGNRYCDFQRGVPEAVDAVQLAERILLPFVVLAELRSGFRHGTRTEENERRLVQFLQRERVEVLWPDEATTHVYAELFADLRRRGKPVPTNDIWIAALCVQHGIAIHSRDRHFDAIPRLGRI